MHKELYWYHKLKTNGPFGLNKCDVYAAYQTRQSFHSLNVINKYYCFFLFPCVLSVISVLFVVIVIVISDRLAIVAKGFLKLPNLHMLLKQRNLSLPSNLVLRTFGKLLTVFSTKVNLLYLLYSTAQRCCLLLLTKQNCLLNTCLRTLILMTQVSLHLFSFLELI